MSKPFEQITIRLDPDLQAKLQREAQQDERPLAAQIRKILRDHTRSQPQSQAAA